MRKWISGSVIAALVLSVSVNALAAWTLLRVDEIQWPKFGSPAISVFNGNAADGALVINGKLPQQRTATDYWPVDGVLPAEHALTEVVLYATRFRDWPNFERFNITQLAGSRQLRFGMERGGTGQFRDMQFCFEDVSPGVGYCPFKITPQGVFVCNVLNVCNKIGG